MPLEVEGSPELLSIEGALVDPMSISLEIFERSSAILEVIEKDLFSVEVRLDEKILQPATRFPDKMYWKLGEGYLSRLQLGAG